MDEISVKRVMPHSLDAEQSVIGSMLIDKQAIVIASDVVTMEDFYSQQYAMTFDAMLQLYNEGQPVDPITTVARLKEMGAPEMIANGEFIMGTINAVPTAANVRYYATIVADKAVERRLIRVTEEIANKCYTGEEPLDSILADTEKRIFDILQNRVSGEFVPIKQVVMNVLRKIEKASQNTGSVTGIATGFIDLDHRTSGLQPSDLILLAARPSMGKTAIVLNIAQYIATKQQKTTAIFSLEMSKEQLVNRFLSAESRVDAQILRNGNLKSDDWTRLVEGAGVIGESKLIIDDTPGITVSELRSKCRKYKLEYDLSVVIIDYLQLMTGNGRSESRQQEISEISRSLKALARELEVPVVALSQLSRAVEQRPDHRPMLSDLRESGAIEQDADVVMFLYRDEYYHHDSPDKGIAELIIAKQRNGPTGTVNLAWIEEHTRFANLEQTFHKN